MPRLSLCATDNGAGAQRKTRAGSVIDQTGAEDTSLRAADPEAAEAYRYHAPGFRITSSRSKGSARAGGEDQLHGKGVPRMGTTADYFEGGPGTCRRTRWYRDERQVSFK